MISLTINNSDSQVIGLDAIKLKELREILVYTTPAQANYFSNSFRSPKRYLMDVKGRFPSGLLGYVQDYLKGYAFQCNDLRIKPNEQEGLFKLNLNHVPYPEQEEAAKTAVDNSRGIISAPTGSGKSTIIALIIDKLQVPTLVVVPSLELKRQLSESLSLAFGSTKVGKGKSIWVENVDALDTAKIVEGYDAIIIDEFHHSGAKTYRTLNKKAWSKIFYRFGLTATPFRSQEDERLLLESVLSEVIYKIQYQDSVDNGRIVPMEAYYYEVPKTEIKSTSWPQVYSQLVVNNDERNALIRRLLLKLHANKVSTLCLVKEIRHGEILGSNGAFKFVSGQNDERHLIELFSKGTQKTLVGTTGVIGEGIDTKACEYVIIAGLGKSKNAFIQQIGRGFRRYPGKESCKIILFLDKSHKFTIRHFKAQVKYLKEEFGIAPVRLES